VVLEFNATHCLSKLTTAWEGLSAGVASFGEQLQVGIFFLLLFGGPTSFASFSHFLPFFCGRSLSLEITLASLARVRLRRGWPLN
jgi:hypothetical protein